MRPYRLNPLLVVALLLLANAAVARWNYAVVALNIDYFTLWSVPHALGSKGLVDGATPNIYLPDAQRALGSILIEEAESPNAAPAQARVTAITSSLYDNRVDATGTPFTYAMVGLLSTGDFERDMWRFQWLSLVCFLLAVIVLCRLLRFPGAALVICLVFFGIGFTPIRADVRAANLNQIQLLALALFILFSSQHRRVLAGIALGFGMAVKPNLIWVAGAGLIFGLADRDYRTLARTLFGVVAFTLGAIVVGAAYFGRATLWWDFLRSVPRTLGHGYQLTNGNYGLAELVATFTDLPLSEGFVLVLVGVLVAVLTLSRQDSPRSQDRGWALHQSFWVAGTGCTLMLLGSPLAWLHYYALMIPVALYLLRPFAADESAFGRERVIGWVVALCALGLLTEAAQQLSSAVGEALMANTATLLLFVGCLYSAWWLRKEGRAAPQSLPSSPRRRRGSVRVRSR